MCILFVCNVSIRQQSSVNHMYCNVGMAQNEITMKGEICCVGEACSNVIFLYQYLNSECVPDEY